MLTSDFFTRVLALKCPEALLQVGGKPSPQDNMYVNFWLKNDGKVRIFSIIAGCGCVWFLVVAFYLPAVGCVPSCPGCGGVWHPGVGFMWNPVFACGILRLREASFVLHHRCPLLLVAAATFPNCDIMGVQGSAAVLDWEHVELACPRAA